MISRAARRAVLDTRWPTTTVLPLALPPTYLLPWPARLYSSATTSNTATGGDTIPESLQAAGTTTYKTPATTPNAPAATATSSSPTTTTPASPTTTTPASSTSTTTTTTTAPSTPLTLDPTITTLLPLLAAQTPHYITAHLHARPYLLTAGDTLRLPFYMHGVKPGDVLRLNRASNLGSRDYTLKGAPYLDERLFECRATVVGVESEPMRVMEKTKRRQRRVKRVKSKMRFTVLRVSEVRVKGLEELAG